MYPCRFYPEEIAELATALQIPDPYITRTRSSFTQIEALGLLLARFRSAGDMYDLTSRYDRPQSAISEIINELTEYLDETWKHLLELSPRNHTISSARMAVYANALHRHGAPLPNIWCFIDCTIHAMCRPSRFQ